MHKEVSESKLPTLRTNFFYAKIKVTDGQMLKYGGDYSHASHNDVSVNGVPHM
jgi:hypothetical protein